MPRALWAGILTTAANLLITGDDQKNLIIYSADKGKVLGTMKEADLSNGRSLTCLTANSGFMRSRRQPLRL